MKKDLLVDALEYIDLDLIEESNFQKTKRLRPRKLMVMLAAAVLVFAFTISAVAESKYEWDIDLMNYMGLGHSTTKQLESGIVQIDISDSNSVKNEITGADEDITFTVTSSIGDDKNAYVKIETNMQLPEGYEYAMPDEWELNVSKSENALTENHACQLEYMEKDGKVYWVMKIEDAEHLNRDYVNLSLGDLYAYKTVSGEEESTLLYEDTWTMNWKYSYKSNKVVSHPYKTLTIDGKTVLLTKIVITPLEVKAYAISYDDVSDSVYDQFRIDQITLKDGSVIRFDQSEGGGSSGSWHFNRYDTYCSLETEGNVLNPKNAAAVTVSGVEVKL